MIRRDEERLEVEFDLTPEDDLEAYKKYYWRRSRGWLAAVLGLLLVSAGVLTWNAARRAEFDRTDIVLMTIVVVATLYALAVHRKNQPKKGSFDPTPIRIVANSEGISNRTPHIEQFSRWPAVVTIKALDYGLAIQTVGFRFFVPSRIFESRQHLEDIAKFLSAMRAKFGNGIPTPDKVANPTASHDIAH